MQEKKAKTLNSSQKYQQLSEPADTNFRTTAAEVCGFSMCDDLALTRHAAQPRCALRPPGQFVAIFVSFWLYAIPCGIRIQGSNSAAYGCRRTSALPYRTDTCYERATIL